MTQQVLVSVGRALQQRPHDPSRAKFRTWLARVSRNATLNALQRAKPDRGSGDSAMQRQLQAVAETIDSEQILTREMQKEAIRAAAQAIEPEFETATWRAFWLTTFAGLPVGDVAAELGKNVGSVYAARSRVMRRLREMVNLLQEAE